MRWSATDAVSRALQGGLPGLWSTRPRGEGKWPTVARLQSRCLSMKDAGDRRRHARGSCSSPATWL
jgi:hypothetical protein